MKRIANILLLLLFAMGMNAQALSSYKCDFEDAVENAQWNLNTPKNSSIIWNNLWYIGSAVSNGGTNSLYISSDGGVTASYAQTNQIMIAWRELTLESGNYDIVFDWRSMGTPGSYIKVCWVPESYFDDFVCGSNSTISGRKWITDNELELQGVDTLYGSSAWQHGMSSLTSDGTPHRLLFVWRTTSTAAVLLPGACIDNIQIARNNCGRPTDLEVNMHGTMATFSWHSSAERFALRYSRLDENEYQVIDDIIGSSVTVPLQHGVYNVSLQVYCQGDTSVWYAFPPVIVYDSNCFNYLDLTDDNCSYSDSTASDYTKNKYKPGKLDYGYAASYSYHTIHYLPGEYDARTYNSKDEDGNDVNPLRTIPEGEIASVRINGWRGRPASVAGKSEENARVARVTYDYVVDKADASNLILKYAVVLQVPTHDELQQPRFTLDIVDAETGEALSHCTTVDFAATLLNAKKEGWYFGTIEDGDSKVIWKDWTTIGLNLAEYDGRHIQVVLSAYGCTASVHYGYAYFTLNCIKGGIEGIQCGNNLTEQFIAPEGFKYHWYKETNPSEKLANADQRIFPVAYDDTTHYAVECIYPTDAGCSFVLTACATPRFPIPEISYSLQQKDCKNIVRLVNTSHIRTKIIKEDRYIDTEARPDYVLWDLGELGSQTYDWEPEISVPATGGRYLVSLRAAVGLCDSTQYLELVIPAISDTVVTDSIQLCAGDFYVYQSRMISSDTTIITEGKTIAGCDSVHQLKIKFVDKIEVRLDTVLAEGDTLWCDGVAMTQTDTYTYNFVSTAGCDSVLTVNLTVVPRLRVVADSVLMPCGDEKTVAIPYKVTSGTASGCKVEFSEEAIVAGWRDTVFVFTLQEGEMLLSIPANIPGWYSLQLRFESEENGTVLLPIEIMVRYPSSLLSQRWSDVIGIKSSETEYARYQWYKNAVAVDNADSPYLYVPDGLEIGAEYSVELFTISAERGVMSCPIVATAVADSEIEITPTVVSEGVPVRIRLSESAMMRLVGVDGVLLLQQQLEEGQTFVSLNVSKGIYFLQLQPRNDKGRVVVIQVR